MAKHKKPAPAAKKKPTAKPSKPAPRPSKSSKPSKPLKPAKPTPSAKKAPKPSKPAKPVPKKVPPVPAKKDNSPAKSGDKHAAKPTAKSTPPIPAKAPAKPESSGKSTPPIALKPTGKTTPPISVPKTAAAPVKAAGKGDAKSNARELLRSRILGSKKASKPIAFSLDEVREIAKTAVVKTPEVSPETKANKAAATKAKIDLSKLEKPATPHHIKAASLADILGFNPKKAQKAVTHIDPENVPEKFRKYYKLLLDLRTHLTEGIELHSEETLKRSSKDDSGDLSSYGQHMADAGTDTFDRDFALSLVSSEQEALTEIDAAIKRIHDGTYGICEATQKPIAKDRLLAVPFTRYSAEAQKDIERNRYRSRSAAGLFGEMGEEGATKMADDGGGDDE
ncbi:transcriptional regulator [Nibricoccus aquaticus]|uniref:Transcriptional regulator n=1 Tax=Nibricoccus aquaticus TaxID=2576891 RepID=A0A290QCX8_9BACT|nr:TraR/DksA C4-type zinc finger protein [Nibricoccus aquaticus]ATC65060.1 transcriptional regulator [Nibricoccus aquaticus]